MIRKRTIILLALLGLFSGFMAGCGSSDYYGTSGYISTGYGYGMHDPFFYDPWYGHGGGTIIVTPPPSRPVRPVHPIEPARPMPRPAPIPRGR